MSRGAVASGKYVTGESSDKHLLRADQTMRRRGCALVALSCEDDPRRSQSLPRSHRRFDHPSEMFDRRSMSASYV
jgi:hypothetical protein